GASDSATRAGGTAKDPDRCRTEHLLLAKGDEGGDASVPLADTRGQGRVPGHVSLLTRREFDAAPKSDKPLGANRPSGGPMMNRPGRIFARLSGTLAVIAALTPNARAADTVKVDGGLLEGTVGTDPAVRVFRGVPF